MKLITPRTENVLNLSSYQSYDLGTNNDTALLTLIAEEGNKFNVSKIALSYNEAEELQKIISDFLDTCNNRPEYTLEEYNSKIKLLDYNLKNEVYDTEELFNSMKGLMNDLKAERAKYFGVANIYQPYQF